MKKIFLIVAMSLLVSLNFAMPERVSESAESDFTFNVPVALHNIPPQVSKWFVWIMVDDEYRNRVAEGMTHFTVTNGEYEGTVTVAFDARPGFPAATAKKYVIWLECGLTNGNSYDTPNIIMKPDGQYPYDGTKPLVWEIRGSLVGQ